MKRSVLCVIYSVYLFCFCFLMLNSCKKNKDDTKDTCTYTSDIKPMIAAKCALPGCHGAGSTVGDFTSYVNLKTRADNGRIQKNVFELKIMPPASSGTLSEQEKQKLKCWLDNGAKQD